MDFGKSLARQKWGFYLQVEAHGELWAVNEEGYREYIHPDNLMEWLRAQAVGISTKDLERVPIKASEFESRPISPVEEGGFEKVSGNLYELPHESQGNYPVCTAMSVTRVFEWLVKKETGEDVQFSVKQAYSESGGSQSGVSAAKVISSLINKGAIEDKYNHFDPNVSKPSNWADLWQMEAEKNIRKPRWKLKERITVAGKVSKEEHRMEMHKALKKYGPLIVTVNATDGWYRGQMPSGKKWKRLHAIALVGYEDGHWIGNNSWNELSDNGSIVKIHNDYPFAFVYALSGVEKR